jgi:predicted O-methyltransferase YrrM
MINKKVFTNSPILKPFKVIIIKMITYLCIRIKKIKKQKFIKRKYPNLESFIINLFWENYDYAMPISLLDKLDKISKDIKLKLIFEFGSGVSTILLANNLKGQEGRIFVFDESLKWIENTYKKCSNVDNIIFMFSPFKQKINYQIFTEDIDINKRIDLLVIDGPTEDRFTENANQLYDKLISSETICAIDDTDREVNDIEAQKLAEKHKLRKVDYKDPLYTNHKYSILYPLSVDDESLFDSI